MALINNLPETERRLQELQREFLADKSNVTVRDEYFMLLRTYARSLTLKEIKRKGIVLPGDRVDEVCTDATLLLLKHYENEGWEVRASFAGTLRWKVIEALYGSADDDKNYSLNRTFSDDTNSKEILDIVENNDSPWASKRSSDFKDPLEHIVETTSVASSELTRLVNQAFTILEYPTFLKFLPWMLLQFRKPKTRNAMETFKAYFLTSKEEEAFEMFLLEIRNRLYQYAQ